MKLKDYLDTEGTKKNAFHKKLGITGPTFRKLLTGYNMKLSLAFEIEKLTHGKVTPKDLYNDYIESAPQQKKEHANNEKPRAKKKVNKARNK